MGSLALKNSVGGRGFPSGELHSGLHFSCASLFLARLLLLLRSHVEEPQQSFRVLGSEAERLTHELDSAWAQAPKSNPVLEFGEHSFYFLSLA